MTGRGPSNKRADQRFAVPLASQRGAYDEPAQVAATASFFEKLPEGNQAILLE